MSGTENQVAGALEKLSELKNTTTFLSQELFHFTLPNGDKLTIVPRNAAPAWMAKNQSKLVERLSVGWTGTNEKGLFLAARNNHIALVAEDDDKWVAYNVTHSGN
jgi:hypothetical protein